MAAYVDVDLGRSFIRDRVEKKPTVNSKIVCRLNRWANPYGRHIKDTEKINK